MTDETKDDAPKAKSVRFIKSVKDHPHDTIRAGTVKEIGSGKDQLSDDTAKDYLKKGYVMEVVEAEPETSDADATQPDNGGSPSVVAVAHDLKDTTVASSTDEPGLVAKPVVVVTPPGQVAPPVPAAVPVGGKPNPVTAAKPTAPTPPAPSDAPPAQAPEQEPKATSATTTTTTTGTTDTTTTTAPADAKSDKPADATK